MPASTCRQRLAKHPSCPAYVIGAMCCLFTAAIGASLTYNKYVSNVAVLYDDAAANFQDESTSLAITAQGQLTMMRRLRTLMLSALRAIGENFSPQQFRDQASTMLLQMPILTSAFMIRPLNNLTQRLEWEAAMSSAFGAPVVVHDGTGNAIPYDDDQRVYFPVETPTNSTLASLSAMLGLDYGSEPARAAATAAALRKRIGVATPPVLSQHGGWVNDRVVVEMRACLWLPPDNDTAPVSRNSTLVGLPTANNIFDSGRATSDTANDTTASQRVHGTVISGRLFTQYLVDTAHTDWFGAQIGALTIEDVTDVPMYTALNLTAPRTSSQPWPVAWSALAAGVSGHGIPWLAASSSGSSGVLEAASFNSSLHVHYGSDLTQDFIVQLGGRDFAMIMSPKPSYLEAELAGASSTLTFGLIGTVAAIVFVSAMVFMGNRAWLRSRRHHDKQLEQVRDRQLLQEQMTSFLSHELRNPSHVISSCAEHVLERLGPAHECKVDMDAIRDSAEAMHRLINDVLTFSALSHRRLEIKHSMLDIRSFVHRIVRSHRSFAMVPILFTVDRAVPACMISDVMRLQQISANGLSNAAKFADTGDIRVTVTLVKASQPLRPDAATGSASPSTAHLASSSLPPTSTLPAPCPMLKFCICDSGPGLSDNLNLDNLFVPFATNKRNVSVHTPTRADGSSRAHGRDHLEQSSGSALSSYAARVRGSGLGLPVSKMLAQLLGGDITLHRDQDMKRTVFCFTMPLVPVEHWPVLHAAWLEHQRLPASAAAIAAAVSPCNVVADVGSLAAIAVPVAPTAAPLAALEPAIINFSAAALPQLFAPPSQEADQRNGAPLAAGEPTTRSSTGTSTPEPPPTAAGTSSPSGQSTGGAELVAAAPNRQRVYALGLHVLVVDDERLNRQVVARMLTRLGCTYELAEDGDEAEDVLVRSGNVPQPVVLAAAVATASSASTSSSSASAHTASAHTSTDSASARDASDSRPGTASSGGARTPGPLGMETSAPLSPRAFDVVLMDIIMRRRCGKETTRRLRAAGMTTPVFAATGNLPGPEFATLFNGVIEKPFTVQVLGSALSGIRHASTAASLKTASVVSS